MDGHGIATADQELKAAGSGTTGGLARRRHSCAGSVRRPVRRGATRTRSIGPRTETHEARAASGHDLDGPAGPAAGSFDRPPASGWPSAVASSGARPAVPAPPRGDQHGLPLPTGRLPHGLTRCGRRLVAAGAPWRPLDRRRGRWRTATRSSFVARGWCRSLLARCVRLVRSPRFVHPGWPQLGAGRLLRFPGLVRCGPDLPHANAPSREESGGLGAFVGFDRRIGGHKPQMAGTPTPESNQRDKPDFLAPASPRWTNRTERERRTRDERGERPQLPSRAEQPVAERQHPRADERAACGGGAAVRWRAGQVVLVPQHPGPTSGSWSRCAGNGAARPRAASGRAGGPAGAEPDRRGRGCVGPDGSRAGGSAKPDVLASNRPPATFRPDARGRMPGRTCSARGAVGGGRTVLGPPRGRGRPPSGFRLRGVGLVMWGVPPG